MYEWSKNQFKMSSSFKCKLHDKIMELNPRVFRQFNIAHILAKLHQICFTHSIESIITTVRASPHCVVAQRGRGRGREHLPQRPTFLDICPQMSTVKISQSKISRETHPFFFLHDYTHAIIQTKFNGMFMYKYYSCKKLPKKLWKEAKNPRKQILMTAADSLAASWELLRVSPHARICSNRSYWQESPGLILAEACESIGFTLHWSQTGLVV